VRFELDLPALRERGNDTIELAEYFLGSFATANAPRVLSEAAKQALLAYAWPGNVRELGKRDPCRGRALAGQDAEVSELPARVRDAHQSRGDSSRVDLDALEQAHIERVLRETGGNRSEAARQLGIDRVTLYRKMKRYQVPA